MTDDDKTREGEEAPAIGNEAVEEPGSAESAEDRTESSVDTQVQTPPPPPPQPVATPERRLMRRPEGKVIAGVCSGLGAYTGIDPVAWRIAFVVLAIVGGGTGLVGYIVAWLVMPMAPEGEPLPAPPPNANNANVGRWIGIGALVLGVVLLFRNVWDIRGGIFWGLLLIGVGIAVWGREFSPWSTRSPNPPPTTGPPQTETSSSLAAPPPPVPPAPPTTPVSPAAPAAPAPSPRRREPSVLGRLVVGAAALAVGVGFLLDNLGAVDLTPRAMVAVLLAIVGAGLLIGTFWGRARWLIIPGIILSLLLGMFSLLPKWTFGQGAGERAWRPTSLREVRDDYRLGAGELLIDLSQVRFGDRSRHIDASVGFGELIVIVPTNVTVHVEGRVGAGEVDLLRRKANGVGVNHEARSRGRRNAGSLDIDAQVGFGEITVRRANDASDISEIAKRRIRIDPFAGPRTAEGHGIHIEAGR